MGRLVYSTVHMRCTSTACRKRFKGMPYNEVCIACGKRAKPDGWNAKKPWLRYGLCYCDGYSWSLKGSPHRAGAGACKFNERNYDGDQVGCTSGAGGVDRNDGLLPRAPDALGF